MTLNIDDIMQVTDAHVLKTYNRFPVAFERGEGTTLYDLAGAPFLDFTAGIGVLFIVIVIFVITAAIPRGRNGKIKIGTCCHSDRCGVG